ncbi:YqhA family protein [Viscerimonas tarda]
MKDVKKIIENVFESFLFNCRFITLIAVLGSLASAIIMFIKSTLQVVNGLIIFIHDIQFSTTIEEGHGSDLVALFVSSVDEYLFATVLLIFSMGLYELFISKIDPASRRSDTRPNWLKINSIDDLKSSLGKVILMVLIVSFFEHSLKIKYDSALELLFLGIGVLFVSAALYLTHAQHKHKHKEEEAEDDGDDW